MIAGLKRTLDIPHLDVTTTVEDFKIRQKKDSPFYEDLVMSLCKELNEVKSRTLIFISLDEDKKIYKRMKTSYDHPNRKNKSSSEKSYKDKPYSIPKRHRVNALEDQNYPKISNYCFSVNILGLLCITQKIRDKAR